MDVNEHLVATLFAARKEMRISGRSVGRAIGVGNSTVSAWEQGVCKPSLEHFVKWAEVLGFDVELIGKV